MWPAVIILAEAQRYVPSCVASSARRQAAHAQTAYEVGAEDTAAGDDDGGAADV